MFWPMAQHPTVKALLDEIEAFRTRNGMTPTRFGQLAVGDGNFTRAIRLGRTPSLGTIEKVKKFMRTYRAQGRLISLRA